LPPNASLEQAMKVAVKFMNDNPKLLDKSSSRLVLESLIDAYPAK
jgi:hypothetical protein